MWLRWIYENNATNSNLTFRSRCNCYNSFVVMSPWQCLDNTSYYVTDAALPHIMSDTVCQNDILFYILCKLMKSIPFITSVTVNTKKKFYVHQKYKDYIELRGKLYGLCRSFMNSFRMKSDTEERQFFSAHYWVSYQVSSRDIVPDGAGLPSIYPCL